MYVNIRNPMRILHIFTSHGETRHSPQTTTTTQKQQNQNLLLNSSNKMTEQNIQV